MIRPKKMVVCSNYPPEAIFTREEDLLPIRRRFKVVEFLGDVGVWKKGAELPQLERQDANLDI